MALWYSRSWLYLIKVQCDKFHQSWFREKKTNNNNNNKKQQQKKKKKKKKTTTKKPTKQKKNNKKNNILMKNFNNSNIDGSFTVADLNSFFYSITNSSASLRQQFFRDILDTLWKVSYSSMKIYVACAHLNSLIEAILMSILLLYWRWKKTLQNHPHLPPDKVLLLTLSGSNYPCVEQISWSRRCSSHRCWTIPDLFTIRSRTMTSFMVASKWHVYISYNKRRHMSRGFSEADELKNTASPRYNDSICSQRCCH